MVRNGSCDSGRLPRLVGGVATVLGRKRLCSLEESENV